MIAAALLAFAANIAPVTLEAVIEVESRGDPLALNVNGSAAQPRHAADAKKAAALARRHIAQGYSVDLGLMQVNSRNLADLGYTIDQVLDDPCANIRAGAAFSAPTMLQQCERVAKAKPPFRLRSALTIPGISIAGSQTAMSPVIMGRPAYQY